MPKKIAIIVEHNNEKVKPILYEMLSMAKKIQAFEQCEIVLFIIGEKIDKLSQCISADTGHDIHAVCIPGLIQYNGAIYNKILLDLFYTQNYEYICAPHSTSGMDYAPALSVALQSDCITGVEDVLVEDGKICFTRAMYGGKVLANFAKNPGPMVITIQPGSFEPFVPINTKPGLIRKVIYECNEKKMIFTGSRVSPSKGSGLDKADVIVSGGRGIGEKENYKYIEMLTTLFQRSAPGASRPICDYGWAAYGKQVGMTGTTVSPKLYIACGISGASQHVGGIKGSQFIVAINTDPDAPVFQIADICIVADAIEFIRLFVKKVKEERFRIDKGIKG